MTLKEEQDPPLPNVPTESTILNVETEISYDEYDNYDDTVFCSTLTMEGYRYSMNRSNACMYKGGFPNLTNSKKVALRYFY